VYWTRDILLLFHQRFGWLSTVTTKAGIPNDHGSGIKVAVTVCTVPILLNGVCAKACQWCIKQWVTVVAVGMFASVASVCVLPVWRTRCHYICAFNGRGCAGEGKCFQTSFWYEIRGATAAVSTLCALESQAQMWSAFSPPTLQSGLRIEVLCEWVCLCVQTLDLIFDRITGSSHQTCQFSLTFCDVVDHFLRIRKWTRLGYTHCCLLST